VLACLQLWTMATGRPDGRALIRDAFPSLASSALVLEYEDWAQAQPVANRPPAPYAIFTTSPLVTWRSSWAPDADGVWVRGGSVRDSHDHRDHGHVNYIVGGHEVLIEAGSTDYAVIMRTPETYQGGLGHNVLQIGNSPGGAQHKGGDAPLAVTALNEQGGEVTVDPSANYDPALLHAWRRHVAWSRHGLQVDDAVTLAAEKPDTITLRWHLAQDWKVTTTPAEGGRSWRVTWPGGGLRLSADAPLTVTTATLPQGISYTEQGTHTCLVVSSAQAVPSLHLRTEVEAIAPPH